MNKKIIILSLVIPALAAALFGLRYLRPSPEAPAEISGSQTLEPFHSIRLKAVSPSVSFESGESYALSYRLHSREELRRLEVKNGVLYFETGFEPKWKSEPGSYQIIITLPPEAELKELDISSIAGDIELSGRNFHSAELESTSGSIRLSDLSAAEAELESISGSIELSGLSIFSELSAKSTSGSVSAQGDFYELDMESVSGRLRFSGSIGKELSAETVSGSMELKAPFSGFEVKSIGGISLDGQKQGGRLSISGSPMLEAESVSGKIQIYTK